jgi:lysophospholipase L1-like esterase
MRMSRVPPAPFERAMTRLARLCNRDLGALVLLLDIDPPGERVLHWQPGLDRRVARYNAILQRVAEAAPGRTVVVPTSGLVKADPSRLLPDGLHRSADGHRLVAGALADVIAAHAAELGLSR